MNYILWLAAILVACLAGWRDWHWRRIPNRLTVTAFAAGLILNTLVFGWAGAKAALLGTLLALALFLPFVLLRGMGAGDWKLMGTIGAFLGPRQLLAVIVTTVLIAGIMAVVDMICARRVKETLKNLAMLIYGFFVFGVRPHAAINLSNANMRAVPFGVAAAMGTILSFALRTAVRIVERGVTP